MVEKVFKIKYKCCNCNHEWTEEYFRGDEVIGSSFTGIHLKSHKCTGEISCPYCYKIYCSKCDSKRVNEIKRETI